MSSVDDADGLLRLLGEERVRQILAATSSEPRSAMELSEECGVAKSTIYRRVEDMLAHDLLIERTRFASDGSHHSVYEAKVDHIDVDIADGTINVRMRTKEDAAERFSRIWDDMRGT